MEKMTISCIKADIGSIGGHLTPSKGLVEAVRSYLKEHAGSLVTDWDTSYIGDDIALLLVHEHGENSEKVHKLAMDTLNHGADFARGQGLYGAGQDLDSSAFSGNVRGMGPAVAEMEFKPRSAEAFILYTGDKTDAGAYNLPLYLAFADPFHCPGLLLAKTMTEGFRFRIIDVTHTEGDRIADLRAPEDLYDIATLLRDDSRYHIESVYNNKSGEIAVRTSACRGRMDKGKLKGKDDPVMICRVQGDFPSSGEVIGPFRLGHYVSGSGRGSHTTPLMPVKQYTPITFFDGPACVSARAYSVSNAGKLTEHVDLFDHPFWDAVREDLSRKFIQMREQGFAGPAMLNIQDLEYGGVTQKINSLEKHFKVS